MRAFEDIELRYVAANVNEKFRVVVWYGDEWRPLSWFEVKEDGSLYLGVRHRGFREARTLSKPLVRRRADISFSEGEPVKDLSSLRGGKVSIHESGRIHVAHGSMQIMRLSEFTKSYMVAHFLFAHPSEFEPIHTRKKRDICVRYPVDEGRPLQISVYVQPLDADLRRPSLAPDRKQVILVVQYPPLDRAVVFVMGSTNPGPWPPATYLSAVGSPTQGAQ